MKDLKFQPCWMMRFPSCTALGTAQRITGGTTWRPLVAEGLWAGGWNYRELVQFLEAASPWMLTRFGCPEFFHGLWQLIWRHIEQHRTASMSRVCLSPKRMMICIRRTYRTDCACLDLVQSLRNRGQYALERNNLGQHYAKWPGKLATSRSSSNTWWE